MATAARRPANMPDGFLDFLERLTKHIIVNQPKNIFEFTASYLESELWRRQNTG